MRSGLELAGRYRLEEPVGRGGMGEVWRGVDVRLRRPVAVKILPLSGAADGVGVARFRREAEIAATLNHPGITTVFDIDEHTDGGLRMLFLVMELMRGRDLAWALHEHPGGLPIAQAMDWAMQILDALSVAHRHGVVHRDIKPANLFLTDDGRMKVCDFGIARLADATKITATGSVAGTPLYMAPEQIEGHTVDERTDLYAFGCVLYQLLTGTTWMDTGSSVGAILHQHLNRIPESPKSVRPDIDDHLSTLVLDLLAKQPDERPKDAATVAERLRGLNSWPTRAARPATFQKAHSEQIPADTRPAKTQAMTDPPQPMGSPASTNTPAHRGGFIGTDRATLERFGLPAGLCLLFASVIDFWNYPRFAWDFRIFILALAVIWVFTTALTPRSKGLTRGIGYVVVTLFTVLLAVDIIVYWTQGPSGTVLAGESGSAVRGILLYLGSALTVAAYCYREIRTRRARAAHDTVR